MDQTISFSTRAGWGTHDLSLERLSAEDPEIEALLNPLVGGLVGPAEDADLVWHLTQAVASPISGTLRWDRLVELCWYQPVDVDRTLEFDRKVTERYTEYCASLGIYYAGTFTSAQLGDRYIVEVHTYDVGDPTAAAELGDEDAFPEDFARIIADCRDLQRRDEPRYILSLVPRTQD